jgi:two-component system, LytTR family, sensor kinase
MKNGIGLFFKYRIWWHILFWIVWYFFYAFTYSSGVLDKTQFLNNLYLLPVRMAGAYSFIYWIIPKFLFKKNHLLFFVLFILHALVFGFSIWLTLYIASGFQSFDSMPFIRPIVLNYQIPATAAAIYLFKRMYLMQQYSLNLEKEKLEAELKFLKSQIHPHFLFNTLNNLYALTLKKSDKAPEMVIQLSNLLEYMLYSGKETEVELNDELKQLKGYIDLEKIRFGNRLKIDTEITGNVDGLLIAPLLLLPFVENSFKHGASNDLKSPFIDLKVSIRDNHLLFSVRNSYSAVSGKYEDFKEGIGLKNVKRRLELLYPFKHSLEIDQKQDNFYVNLTLELNTTGIKNSNNEI